MNPLNPPTHGRPADLPADAPAAADAPTGIDPASANNRTVRVHAIVPCYNRPDELTNLVGDLARLDRRFQRRIADPAGRERTQTVQVALAVTIVDNGSTPPLTLPANPDPEIRLELLRLEANSGGSGGFNAGMSRALSSLGVDPEFLWLVDSDARLEHSTLIGLVRTLMRRPDAAAVGPALADPVHKHVFEVGGRVDPRTGTFGPLHRDIAGLDGPVECDYAASCCLLVRSLCIREVGLMPDVFLNGDDVEWCLQLARHPRGGVVLADPATRAFHPRFDRFPTWARLYHARNGMGPLAAMGAGRVAILRRGLREASRAANQELMGRDDLAALHVRGLRELCAGRRFGAVENPPAVRPWHPLVQLPAAVSGLGGDIEKLSGTEAKNPSRPLVLRLLLGAGQPVAVVPARGGSAAWFAGRAIVSVTPEGFAVTTRGRLALAGRAIRTWARCAAMAVRLAAAGVSKCPLPGAPSRTAARAITQHASSKLTLTTVVLSFNRRQALLDTLKTIQASPVTGQRPIVVVDNASADGSADAAERITPHVVRLERNIGVSGFNRGVEEAESDLVLILDDDARPDAGSLASAIALMERSTGLAAVALHPRHPATGRSEWPFATGMKARGEWPVMGCGNLVRRGAWLAVGGYEDRFFLYRNDTDLAMKLLGAGYDVHFNPAWVVWHDSAVASRKPPRWFHLATRNWVWLARRHGRGLPAAAGMLLAWLWAHRLAGFSAVRHFKALRGLLEGLFTPAPALRPCVQPDGRAFAALVSIQLRSLGRRADTVSSTVAPPSRVGPASGIGPSAADAAPAGASPGAPVSASSTLRHSA